ncbi:S41 family peptidase [Piscibacillus sp. B03]
MMFDKIFEEIIDIIHHDYAGCDDKRGWDDPDHYRKKITNQQLTHHEFVELVEDYLADLKDPHMFFNMVGDERGKDVGFRVRRHKDALYVTELMGEDRLELGDRIVALDDINIPELCEIHKNYLYDEPAERENWRSVLKKYKIATVVHTDGHEETLDIQRYEKPEYTPEYSFKQLQPNTAYIKMTDFMNPDAINQLVAERKDELDHSDYLIIDVRKNRGGSDSSFQALIPYIFPEGKTTIDLSKDYVQVYNVTNRSADLTITSIQKFLDNVDDQQIICNAQTYIDLWDKNRGKGLMTFDNDLNPEPYPIEGKATPKHVVVLGDVYCGSAGDIFVELSKLSEKVTVLGRGTAGVNDYSNLVPMTWDNQFELMYPTSKLKRIDEGKGMTGIGILPDVHIPWTPEHLERDIDLEEALSLLNQKEFTK